MKNPVLIQTDYAARLVKFVCGDCGMFSFGLWTKEVADKHDLQEIIEKESQLCKRASCKCETPRLEVGELLVDPCERRWQVISVKPGNTGTVIEVYPLNELSS